MHRSSHASPKTSSCRKAAGLSDIRASWPKPKLIEYYVAAVPFATAFTHCGAANFIALDRIRPVEFLLYLYFGKTEDDLKNLPCVI